MKVISGGMKAVAAGFGHSMVLAHDGSMWTTGWNVHGQFGDGSTTSTIAFFRVLQVGNGGRRMIRSTIHCENAWHHLMLFHTRGVRTN